MKKIVICGLSATGKTTLAKELRSITGIPVSHYDAIFWKEGQTVRPLVQRKEILQKIVETPSWIIDGGVWELGDCIEYADHLVYIRCPRLQRLCNLIRRILGLKGKQPPDFSNRKRHILDLNFVVKAIFRTGRREKALRLIYSTAPSNVKCILLNSQADKDKFINLVKQKISSND